MTPERERERALRAAAAADAAHELERLLLALSHNLRRGETPDAAVSAFIRPARDRLNALIALALSETAP